MAGSNSGLNSANSANSDFLSQVQAHVQANKGRYLEELKSFIRQPSISTIDVGMGEASQMLAAFMRRLGIRTTIYPTRRHPVVFGEIGPEDGAAPAGMRTLLVYGHYDVQPPEPLEKWVTPPFEPAVRDGKLYGRGTSDNKGQLFAHLKGLESYLAVTGAESGAAGAAARLPIKIKYLFEGEEETGSPNLRPFVLEHKELLRADAAIFSDSHYHESGRPSLILGLKGLLPLELRAKELASDQHSMKATVLPSAPWRLVTLLSTIKGEDGLVKIDGFYDTVRAPLPEEMEAADRIPVNDTEILKAHGAKHLLDNRFGRRYYHNMMFEPTFNISGLVSGYTGKGTKTVLPAEASVKIDIRLVPDMRPDDIHAKVVRHLEKHGYGDVEVARAELGLIPSRTPITNPYVEVARRAAADAWGDEPVIFPSTGGAGPNYIFTDDLGVPCIVIPFAASDQANHAPNESLVLDGFEKGIVASAMVIKYMSES